MEKYYNFNIHSNYNQNILIFTISSRNIIKIYLHGNLEMLICLKVGVSFDLFKFKI